MPAKYQTSLCARTLRSSTSMVVKSRAAPGFYPLFLHLLAVSLGQVTPLSVPQYFSQRVVVKIKCDGKTFSEANVPYFF